MTTHHVYKLVRETKTKVLNISASLVLVAMSLGGALPAFITGTAHAAGAYTVCATGCNFSTIQAAINGAASGDTITIEAGTYDGNNINVNKSVSLAGEPGAVVQVPDTDQTDAFDVNANNVTIQNLTIVGPADGTSYQTYAWGSTVTRGIAIHNGYTDVAITGNTIKGLRNDILVDGRNTGSITNNTIDNSKSGISVQYTDAGTGNSEGYSMSITGNHEGPYGNEWGLNTHLNGHYTGVTYYNNSQKIAVNAPSTVQAALLANSAANGGWTVQDQGYSTSNRTAVAVAPAAPAADSNQGSPLSPMLTIDAAIDAVVSGGKVNVAPGYYSMLDGKTVSKQVDLEGNGATIVTSGPQQILTFTAPGSTFNNFSMEKVDNNDQVFIGVQAANTTISNNTFSAQYTLAANAGTTRALVVSTTTGVNVTGNTFNNIRQPAYINNSVSGAITDNYTNETRGWVVVSDTNLTFTGNTWGTNATDIAIINQDTVDQNGVSHPSANNYTCTVMAQIKADNNNATIDNQVMTDPCSIPAAPSNLHIHYQGDTTNLPVDANGNYVVRNTAKNIVLDWTNDTTANVNINGVRTHVVFPDGSSTYFYQGVPYNYTNLNPRDSGQKFAANGQGKYTYTVEVKNTQGWSAASAPVVIYYAKDIPTATFKATPPRYVNGDFTITVVGNDTAVLDSVGADVRDPQDTTGNSWRANCSNPQPLNGATLPAYSDNGSGVTIEVTCTVNTVSLVDGHTYTLRARAGFVEANGQSYGNVNADGNWTFTVDRDAPAAPTITAPTARQWFKSTPIVNSWTAVTKDVNGNPEHVDHYQVAYAYDDGHSFSGSTCSGVTIGGVSVYCRDASGTSRNHVPASNEEGGVTIWVRAVDQAGNAGAWSTPVHYYYDHTNPLTDIHVSQAVKGIFTVSGTASDNLALNRVYVQLVNTATSQRYGGTTISLITTPFSSSKNWSLTYDARTLGLPDGTYEANVEAVDMAGNSFNPGWTSSFVVDSTAPTVTINSSTGTDTTPTLTGTVNDPTAAIAVTIDGSTAAAATNNGDGTWSFTVPTPLSTGSHTVVVTATDTAQNAYSASANITVQAPPASPNGLLHSNGDGNSNNAPGHQSTVTVTPNDDGHVLGDTTGNDTADASNTGSDSGNVKGDNVVKFENSGSKKSNSNFLGLGWWWIPVIVVVAFLWWLLAARRRDDET